MSRFTVKWVVNCDGVMRHRIIDADQISYACDDRPSNRPASQALLGVYSVPIGGLVVIGNPHDGAESMAFSMGVVYVMNEAGKTCATYKLEHGLDPILCADVVPSMPSIENEPQPRSPRGETVGLNIR